MRFEPLYRVKFSYPEAWFVELEGERGTESQHHRRLNDVVCVICGEARPVPEGAGCSIVLDVPELVWEAPGD